MQIGGFSSAEVASAVWVNTTRTLTGIAGAFADAGSISTNVNAGATLDLRPAAGKVRLITALSVTASNLIAKWYDGVTLIVGTAEPSVTSWFCGPTIGVAINNASAGALNATYTCLEVS